MRQPSDLEEPLDSSERGSWTNLRFPNHMGWASTAAGFLLSPDPLDFFYCLPRFALQLGHSRLSAGPGPIGLPFSVPPAPGCPTDQSLAVHQCHHTGGSPPARPCARSVVESTLGCHWHDNSHVLRRIRPPPAPLEARGGNPRSLSLNPACA